jgi:hypothetical protein
MSDLLSSIDATRFERFQPRAAVAPVGDGMVTLAVVSILAMSTFIVVAALAGPISRFSAPVEIRLRSADFAEQSKANFTPSAWRSDHGLM